MKIKAVIIEDEINVQETLISLIDQYCHDLEVVATAESIQSAKKIIKEFEPNLVFLDVHLPDGEGFEVFEENRKLPKIICTTAYESFAIEAIKHAAVAYLLKPIIHDELIEAVEKAKIEIEKEIKLSSFSEKNHETVIFKTKDEIYKLHVKDLLYCEADGNYTKVHLLDQERTIMLSKTLKVIEEQLSHFGFLRVHQSFLVNTDHIVSLSKNDVILSNHNRVKVSRRKKTEVLKYLN